MKKLLIISILLTSCSPRTTSYSTWDNSCRVSVVSQGTLIYCPQNGTSALITNGVSVSSQPFCPNKSAPNGFQESYLIASGLIYAILDTGSAMGVYLTYIHPGNYTTSDGSGCTFTVNSDNTITVTN